MLYYFRIGELSILLFSVPNAFVVILCYGFVMKLLSPQICQSNQCALLLAHSLFPSLFLSISLSLLLSLSHLAWQLSLGFSDSPNCLLPCVPLCWQIEKQVNLFWIHTHTHNTHRGKHTHTALPYTLTPWFVCLPDWSVARKSCQNMLPNNLLTHMPPLTHIHTLTHSHTHCHTPNCHIHLQHFWGFSYFHKNRTWAGNVREGFQK